MATILKKIINIYHMVVSPWLGTRCRFVPTCSEYARQALDQHDVLTATTMTARRICRCHPWGGQGFDPVSPSGSKTPDIQIQLAAKNSTPTTKDKA